MKKKTRNGWLALLLMVSVVFADMMPSLALTVQAAQEESAQQGMAAGTSVTAETSGGEVPSTQEKQLVQCSDDWVIFQYLDESNNPTFYVRQILYPISKVESNKLLLQYRVIYKNDKDLELKNSSWNDLNTNISSVLVEEDSWDDDFIADDSTCAYETTVTSYYHLYDTKPVETINDIKNNKTDYFIQFRLVNTDNKDNTLSKSYTLIIYPQEEPFPYVVSSNIDCCEAYDVIHQSTDFTVTLVFNDLLYDSSITGMSLKANYSVPSNCLSNETYQKNLVTNLYGNYAYVDNKRYLLNRTEVSFDVKLPSYHLMNTDENLTINCLYTLNDLEGKYTKKAPDSFMFSICVPSFTNHTSAFVENINISAPSSTVKPGSTITLTPNVLPEDAEDKSVTWSSSNSAYATVDANGVVTANAAGAGKSVVITATANDGSGVSGTYTLYIETIPVTGITIKGSATNVTAGDKVNLSATVAPSNATNSGITWSSSNTAYATVDANGVVTTKAAGAGKSVVITATANDGSGVKSTFNINIKKVNVTKISLSTTTKTVQAGKKATVKAAIAPTNATNKAITWTSSNTKFATVNSKGVVTTKKAGIGKTVTITAKAKDGSGKKSSIKIKIVKTVKVSKIKLTTSSKTVKAGKKVTVKAAITPVNATNKKVTWTSSNKDYATVNSKGVVTTKKAGKGKTVTITAKAKDGSGKKAMVKIKIR